ncbi:FMN-dependent NADH-azoreductase [Nocardia sp. NPDC051321]|uniref:FMN-dependent NADH-azoreductase n=1 Tax=Nocardia sp. NPDC051321 TaxID=3364323 RepID=UPI0037A05085
MSYLLHIDTSALGEGSISRQIAQSFRDEWQGPVVHRDLAVTPVPHLSAAGVTVRVTDPADRTVEEIEALAIQDELIEEFLGAGAYLFTVPLYNLTVPSVFKAWLDQILVVGRTMNLTGPVSTAGRPAVVVSARGGGYGPGTPKEGMDHLVPTLEHILGEAILGLDLTVITPELTMVPHVPVMAPLLPLHEASMLDSHNQARRLGSALSSRSAA